MEDHSPRRSLSDSDMKRPQRRSLSENDVSCFGICDAEFEPYITCIMNNFAWDMTEPCCECDKDAKYYAHVNRHYDSSKQLVEYKAGHFCLDCIAYIFLKAKTVLTRVNSLGRIKDALTPPSPRKSTIGRWFGKRFSTYKK